MPPPHPGTALRAPSHGRHRHRQRRVSAGWLPVGGDRLPLGIEGRRLYLLWLPLLSLYLLWLPLLWLHLLWLPLLWPCLRVEGDGTLAVEVVVAQYGGARPSE